MTNNILVENQYKRDNLFKKENVNYLIRILTRFGTIPKINGVDIITNSEQSDIFKIVPGKSIIIGSDYLEKPVVALIYIRYAIEWQIWYKASNKDSSTTALCDLAALRVSLIFFNLLPKKDKVKIEDSSFVLTNAIKGGLSDDISILQTKTKLLNKLQSFHGLTSKDLQLKDSWVSVVEYLARPTEDLLMSGGDLRLNIDENDLLNKYGCRPFPRPAAFTFASSTATSVSNYAFDKAEKARTILINRSLSNTIEKATHEYSELLKSNLRSALSINNNCQIIFSPSGTDSSLQIAAMAQIISSKEITHVLVGSEETGSGVPAALKGLHFEKTTALGIPITKGDEIDGFRNVEVAEITFRDENGSLKSSSQIDQEVFDAVFKANKTGRYIVLHAMDQSKLGYQSPSDELIEKINTIENLSMQIIVDGAQLRLDVKDINNYLNKGYILMITGSKYFTGPPYSGALIVPKSVGNAIESVNAILPKGLTEYYNRYDWPAEWACSKQLSNGFNYGTYMRWNAAIVEMKRYFETPILYRNLGVEMFCNFVEESILESPILEQLFEEHSSSLTYNSDEFGLRTIRTIFPFFIKKEDKVLDIDDVKKLYLMLNSNISDSFKDASIETVRLATQKCHIGQAVSVRHQLNKQSAILRISLGARVISDSWKDRDVSMFFRNIAEQMSQIATIIRKIELIINHPDLIKIES
ncbi:MAG: hypothetical protein J7K29_05110 [Candidatus Cloacimonetes bacterium]|nr:hypothetical protein [Candidatus Cloacimonadota bacterium]